LAIGPRLRDRLSKAEQAVARLVLAEEMVGGAEWLVDALVRREAVLSAQIAGIGARVADLMAFEADDLAIPSPDVADALHGLDAFRSARATIGDPKGPSLSQRVLCDVHRALLRADEDAGRIRHSIVWIGANRPEGAVYVPPPPNDMVDALTLLEKYVATPGDLPPLVRAGLVHAQLALIHPFVDGNGRIARLMVPALLERWGVMRKPLLGVSPFIRNNRQEYHRRLEGIRVAGDWEGWTELFLDAATESANHAVGTARDLAGLLAADRSRVLGCETLSAAALRLFELLPSHPLLTVARAMKLLGASKPTAGRAIDVLSEAGVLAETTGKKRDRWFAYEAYLAKVEAD
jgi:Fic family protein